MLVTRMEDIKNEIKLIIWDLDDTFWQGTLTEGAIEINSDYINLVKALTARGIMNSICSKNNFEQVREILINQKIWDYFIFPSISWKPKGEQIAKILANAQLRPQNTLFIDDNHMNLEEAAFYNQGLYVIFPDLIDEILHSPQCTGKNDERLVRLHQYKELEARQTIKRSSISNMAFLEKSNIRVEILHDCEPYLDRIFELIHRTNQLNFTKKKPEYDEFKRSIQSKCREQGCIHVFDDYGDYGIVGYYAKSEKQCLEHFLFSCRVLNLGVEQWVYAKIGFPDLLVQGQIIGEVNKYDCPNWINKPIGEEITLDKTQRRSRISCLLKGGCDLEQLSHYLVFNDLFIEKEFNYVSKEGIPIHREHSEIIRSSVELSTKQKTYLCENIPFYDRELFKTKMFDGFDVVVYSVLMDYTQALYRSYENENMIVTYGDFCRSLTEKENQSSIMITMNNKINVRFLTWFSQHFRFIGPTSEERLVTNLQWIRNKLNKDTVLILINGAEVSLANQSEFERYTHHKKNNKVLQQFVKRVPNTYLVDVNQYVHTSSDITDNIRHYKRHVYFKIASEITDIIEKQMDILKMGIFRRIVMISFNMAKLLYKKIANKFTYL